MGRLKAQKCSGVKKYISYVFTRCVLINSGLLRVSDNEAMFYKKLKEKIIEYRESNKLFFDYELGRITYSTVVDRTRCKEVNAWANKQRKILINYLLDWETRIFAVYPFEDRKKAI